MGVCPRVGLKPKLYSSDIMKFSCSLVLTARVHVNTKVELLKENGSFWCVSEGTV